MEAFFKLAGLPITLEEAGIPMDRIEEMAEKAAGSHTIGSFVKLGKEDIVNILNLSR